MRYGTVALACITMLCASVTLAEEAMRRLGDLRRSDYVVTSLADVTNDVAELKASVGAVSNDVSDLRALVSTLGGVTNDISALSGYSVLSNDVASLKDGYVGVTNDVAELKSDVGGLETAVTAIDGTLATATNAIDQIGQFASNSWNTTDAYLDYLEDYATNNYMAARLANYRAYRLELWRQNDTNELAKIDGMRPLSDNIAQASSFGDWVISAPSNSVTGWALVFTPDSSNETVGTWSILSGDSLVAMSGPSMARDISELGTNDWFTSSVTPAPTASRIVKTTAGQPYVTYDIIGDLLRRADESTNVTFKIDGDELVISTNSVPVWRSGATAASVSLTQAVEVVTNASASAVRAMASNVQTNEIAGAMTLSVGDRSVTFYDNAKVDEKVEAAGKVKSVNGKEGVVALDADSVGAIPAEQEYRWEGTIADPVLRTVYIRSEVLDPSDRDYGTTTNSWQHALYSGLWKAARDGFELMDASGRRGRYVHLSPYSMRMVGGGVYTPIAQYIPYTCSEAVCTRFTGDSVCSNYVDAVGKVVAHSLSFDASAEKYLFPTKALTADQEAKGLSYTSYRDLQQEDGAIAIGRHAKAAVDDTYLAKLSGSVTPRSVSIAIGDYADASRSGERTQALAIGWFAQAKGNNAIAIGMGGQHTNETAMTGDAAYANQEMAIAVGYSAKATGWASGALGGKARASGANSWQIGEGTVTAEKSLKFRDTYIVSNGVPCFAAANASIDEEAVNRLAEAKLKELLAPVTITDAGECMITAKSHTITTISPTNGVVADFDIVAGASRNYEIYVPNTENTRRGLPCVVKLQALDDTTLVGVGQWWDRKITRLPALFKLREPVAGTVILDVETYDDGTDWTPQVTNAVWSTTNGVMTLEKVQGVNLHNAMAVIVTYTNATDAVASNSTTNFTPRYAELDMGNAFDGAAFMVSESDLMAGTTPEVTVTTVEGTNGYRTLNSLLDEKNKGWR